MAIKIEIGQLEAEYGAENGKGTLRMRWKAFLDGREPRENPTCTFAGAYISVGRKMDWFLLLFLALWTMC